MPGRLVMGRDVRLVEAIAARHAQEVRLNMRDWFRGAGPLIGVKASLKTLNIHIHESYRFIPAVTEQVNTLVLDFGRSYRSTKRYCDVCMTS
jgi:hypothetical protein